jgi:magnesium transporter
MSALDTAEVRERALTATELQEAWPVLSPEERLEGLRVLPHAEAEDFLLALPARDQTELILSTSPNDRRSWMRLMPPDDAADVIQEAPEEERENLLALLDDPTRKEVAALLAYAEDDAGGLMSPRFARLRPDMRVDEAISYLRRQTREGLETIYYVFVLEPGSTCSASCRSATCSRAAPDKRVRDIMSTGRRHGARGHGPGGAVASVRAARLPRHPRRRRRGAR